MKSQSVLVLMALLSIFAIVSSQYAGQVYCGRRLAVALSVFCNGNLVKRSESQYTSPQSIELSWPWVNAHRAHSMGRSKRQVVAECCDKPCTINELMSYCGN